MVFLALSIILLISNNSDNGYSSRTAMRLYYCLVIGKRMLAVDLPDRYVWIHDIIKYVYDINKL